jgi:uncharacterized repeat protein (TIGR03803 family)
MKTPRRLALVGTLAFVLVAASPVCIAQKLSPSALAQISALEDEKAAFTPAQKKMDSQLVFALKRSRKESIAKNTVPLLRVENKADANGMVEVDISGRITPNLLRQIQDCGGQLRDGFHASPLGVRLPMNELEKIAALPEVRFIGPAAAMHADENAIDAEGIQALDASSFIVQSYYGIPVNGGGVKVGVISDSVDFLSGAQASNDLGPVTVLPGQSGVPDTGEGTALLEIVHAVAPGAQLFFATFKPTLAQFATNILNLRLKYGCDIIIDDAHVEQETPFQDDVVAQAIAAVTADGALYLASAGNEGNSYCGTSGTWEGDFASDGPASAPLKGKGLVHNFAATYYGSVDSNTVVYQSPTPRHTELFWSDPWGASTNDYDLFVLDANGVNVVESSVTVQNGSQDPIESVSAPKRGEMVVIVLAHGSGRFLHLTTQGGELEIGTDGATRGHNACPSALTIAAMDAFGLDYSGNFDIEPFSSDGPRQMFYYADGAPITPGDFSSSGGAIFPKPDISAPDDVTTTVFNPFYGTSAAVANAAGLAALIDSINPSLSVAEVTTLLETNGQSVGGGPHVVGYGEVTVDSSLPNTPAYNGPASVSLQPPNEQAVAYGAPFVLNGAAMGAPPLSYQWQLNGTNLSDTGDFSGSTTSNLTVAGTSLADAGAYSLVASNLLGGSISGEAAVSFGPVSIVGILDRISNSSGGFYFTEPGVVEGTDGNLYGATTGGGTNGLGALFSMTPGGTVTELYDFGTVTNDGAFPNTLVQGEDGNFYGTTQQNAGAGVKGIIFKLTASGQYTLLYNFTNGLDGSYPLCGLSLGNNGVLYGTTSLGGAGGFGTIYALTTSGQVSILYSFTNNGDGANPSAAPILGKDGYLYGTTSGYISAQIPGSIYKLSPSGRLTTLYTFTNGLDGGTPWSGLTAGSDGNYYGISPIGGVSDLFGNTGGTVFRITPGGVFTVLHTFSIVTEGMAPAGKLALGPDNNLYGTVSGGGPGYALLAESYQDPMGGVLTYSEPGWGSVFKMTLQGKLTVLYFFSGAGDGFDPAADLFSASDGNIYAVSSAVDDMGNPSGENIIRIDTHGFGPAILVQPQDRTVIAGSNALFSVASDGARPLSCQWQFGGVNIAGATNSSLAITNVQKKQVGSYRVVIRNPVGSVISSSASLSIGTPVVITRQPQSQNLAAGARASFTVAATGSAPLHYQWQRNGANLAGATAATLAIAAVTYTNAGAYSVLVSNGINIAASTNALLAVFPPAPVITSPAAGFQSPSNSLTVAGKTGSSGVTNVLVQVGEGAWQAAVLSHNGANWSALVALAPGTNAFAAVAQTPFGASLPASSAFVFNPFINAAGVYDGLFLDTNNPSAHSAGSLTLTVSSTRSFSGRITRSADAESFTGKFDLSGAAQLPVPVVKSTPLGLSLLLDLEPGAYGLSGSVSNSGVFNASLLAWRAYSGSVTNYPPASTFAIFPNLTPPGYSYGVAHLASGGSVTVTAYLLDGTTFTVGGPLLQNGRFPLFAILYNGRGSLISWVSFTNADLGGSVDWFQTNGVTFTNWNLTGYAFAPPPAAPVLALTNGGLALFGGNLPTPLTNAISISSKNVVTPGAGTIPDLTAAVSAATGLFCGTFRYPSTGKSVSFHGALLPPINSAFGYFVESNQSGGVIIGNFPLAIPNPQDQ